MEEFRPIPWYEGLYEVSNLGRIKSLEREKRAKKWCIQVVHEKILIQWLSIALYNTIILCKQAKIKRYLVHRLVGWVFLWLDINNNKQLVCHKDDNKNNNKVDNLFLWNVYDNMQDMIRKWRWVDNSGEKHWMCKLTNNQIEEIRQLPRHWYKNIAEKYWVTPHYVSMIKNKLSLRCQVIE